MNLFFYLSIVIIACAAVYFFCSVGEYKRLIDVYQFEQHLWSKKKIQETVKKINSIENRWFGFACLWIILMLIGVNHHRKQVAEKRQEIQNVATWK